MIFLLLALSLSFAKNADYLIESSSFIDMFSIADGGSAIRIIDQSKTSLIKDCNMKNCTTTGNDGGAIYLHMGKCDFLMVCGIGCMSYEPEGSGQLAYIITEKAEHNYFNYTTAYECGKNNNGLHAYFLNNYETTYTAWFQFHEMNASSCINNIKSETYFSAVCHLENVNGYYNYVTITNNEGNSLFSYFLTQPIELKGINIINNTVRYGFNFGSTKIDLRDCCYYGNVDRSKNNNLVAVFAGTAQTVLTVYSSFFEKDVSSEPNVVFTGGSVVTPFTTSYNIVVNDKKCTFVYPPRFPSETQKFTESGSFTLFFPPTNTFTPSNHPVVNVRANVKKDEEAKIIATSAGITVGVSVFLIVAGVLLMLIYLRIKTHRKKLNSFDNETESFDTHTTDYSYSYTYSYYSYSYSYSAAVTSFINENQSNMSDDISIHLVSDISN